MSASEHKRSGMRSRAPVILLVEDSADLRALFAEVLGREGFLVIQAGDGREAVDKALRTMPDLIVMDLWLPVLDGFSAARVLRTYETTRRIPILALTGYTSVIDADIGFADILFKPCRPQTLAERVRAILRRAPGRSQRRAR